MGILGLDLGERRIGVAVVDAPGGRARPLVTLPRRDSLDADAEALGEFIRRFEVTEIVVGLPLEAAGDEGPQARRTREWAEALAQRTALPVRLRDERLTSHLAEERLGRMRRGRSGGPPTSTQRREYRARVDREAAAIILQDDLDARTDEQP
jgi:putative Holliday junction resolvase